MSGERGDAGGGGGERHAIVAGYLAEEHERHRPREREERAEAARRRPAAQQEVVGAGGDAGGGALASDDEREQRHLQQLRDERGERGAADAHPHPLHEVNVEDEVERARREQHQQWRRRVLGAEARRLQHRAHHKSGEAEQPDREVARRGGDDRGRLRADEAQGRLAKPVERTRQQQAAAEGAPERVAQHIVSAALVARGQPLREQRSRGDVEPEEEVRGRVGEHRRRAEGGELGG